MSWKHRQKAILLGVFAVILLLWFGAVAVICSSMRTDAGESAAVSSALESDETESGVVSSASDGEEENGSAAGSEDVSIVEQEDVSAAEQEDDSTVDSATGTVKLEPVDASPKDNGEEQVTAVWYTESDQLKGFFSLNGKWVCVYLQLDNWGSSKIVTPYDFVLVADGVSYYVSDLNYAGSDPLQNTGVGQSASLQGTLIYEVPLDAEQYQLQYIGENGTLVFQLN